LVEGFIRSDRIAITPKAYNDDPLRRRVLLTLNMNRVVQHIWEAIRFQNAERLEPVFDHEQPIRSTGNMPTWYTGNPCERTDKSHISHCVYDSTWEASEAFDIDHSDLVTAWAKNDHLGFEIVYVFNGVVRKFRPDFLIRLATGTNLVLEVKGEDTQQNKTKRKFLAEWVDAVNQHGGFGRWSSDVSFDPNEVPDILAKHAGAGATVDH